MLHGPTHAASRAVAKESNAVVTVEVDHLVPVTSVHDNALEVGEDTSLALHLRQQRHVVSEPFAGVHHYRSLPSPLRLAWRVGLEITRVARRAPRAREVGHEGRAEVVLHVLGCVGPVGLVGRCWDGPFVGTIHDVQSVSVM